MGYDRDWKNDTRFLWKGKEYIYSKCRNTRWVGYYPVMFHGHITHSQAYLQAFEGSIKRATKVKYHKVPSQRVVYELMSGHDFRLPNDIRGAFHAVFAKTRHGVQSMAGPQ